MDSNLKVAVRIRPKSLSETFEFDLADYDSETIKVIQSDQYVDFKFQKIFGNRSTQDDVYSFISPMIQSSCKGINSTVMVYGQTGSGKTYTMFGNDENPGIFPKVFDYIFQELDSDYTVLCSIMLIRNEKLYDLLSSSKDWEDLAIRENNEIGIHIPGLIQHPVQSPEESNEVIKRAYFNNYTKMTQMQIREAREIVICQISIECNKPNEEGLLTKSKIMLCDLAGSERIPKDLNGFTAGNRNSLSFIRSLRTLEDVFSQLGASDNLSKYIPYRNSKLTRLLKDALDGTGNICLIATVSPTSRTVSESINTLRFASIAKNVPIHLKSNHMK